MTPRQIEKCAQQLEAFHDRLTPLFADKRQRPCGIDAGFMGLCWTA